MSLLFSMCLDLFGKIEPDLLNNETYFNDEERAFIEKCAHTTNLDYSIEDQRRLVALAATFFVKIDGSSPVIKYREH